MSKTMKINVEFQLVVPIRTDSAGRRLSIMDQASPYISDYFADLNIALSIDKHHNHMFYKDGFNYDAQPDFDLNSRMDSCYKSENLLDPNIDESRIRWEKQKDLECWEFFKMTWKEFKTLSWTQQAETRKENNVIWENNNWAKKG
jgi:hypothetical protein